MIKTLGANVAGAKQVEAVGHWKYACNTLRKTCTYQHENMKKHHRLHNIVLFTRMRCYMYVEIAKAGNLPM